MAVGTLAALLGASAVSSAASMYNNRKNIEYAQEANDIQVGLANTAHQREVRDLEAAGLNPILSASSNGASTPQLRTPSLQSIDGGIANSAGGIARAVNGMVDAEVKAAQADADIAKANSDVARGVARAELEALQSNTALQVLENQAREDALRGTITVGNGPVGDSYINLVKQYQNEIESGRYKSSLGHAIYDDIRSGISSAADVVGAAKNIKSMRPSTYEEEYNIDRYDRNGHRIGSETRSRFGRR